MIKHLRVVFFIACLLIFKVSAPFAQPLCLDFVSFSAQKNDCAANLSWTFNQCSTGKYLVEYSLDASSYTTIGIIKSNSMGEQNYAYADNYACPGNLNYSNVYYRVRFMGDNGNSYFSPVRRVTMGNNCSCANNNTNRCSGIPSGLAISGSSTVYEGSAEMYMLSNDTYPAVWSISNGSAYASLSSTPANAILGSVPGTGGVVRLNATIYGCRNIARDVYVGCGFFAPTSFITSPANGDTLSGTAWVSSNSCGSGGVTRVEFYVDDVLKGTSTTAPYTWQWTTATASNDVHTLTSKAYDANGNVGTSPLVSVSVSNACAHSLCETGDRLTPTCDDPYSSCVGRVCSADHFCCDFGWDDVCVSEANYYCSLSCY